MSAALVSFLLSLGVSTWLYSKLQRKSGNNTEQSLIAACVSGAAMFLILYTVLGLLGF